MIQPTDQAWLFDPTSGSVYKAKGSMNLGRGAHAAVLLPQSGLVLVAGGSENIFRGKSDDCFPWYFRKEKAGIVGFTSELFNLGTETFLKWDSPDWPDGIEDPWDRSKLLKTHSMIQQMPRVFPSMSLNRDGSVIVAGDGQWPSCKTSFELELDYQAAELYMPGRNGWKERGFVETHDALTMQALRTGHVATLVEVRDHLATHLFLGGG